MRLAGQRGALRRRHRLQERRRRRSAFGALPQRDRRVLRQCRGEVLNEVLARINLNARIVLCGSISKSDAATPQPGPANYSNLVARRARMEGLTGLDYPTRIPEAFEALASWQRAGSLVHKEDVAYGLGNAPQALLRLFSGENLAKQLVKV